ncbi:hypothetical protein G6F31_016782 [Rhizopus arrhizus]|nr:hypothetical protein G6F31_016782 [Rhizopus arrhizus]
MAPVPAIAPTAMPLLELTQRCTEATQPRYENALEDVGALAVTLLDAEADTSNEQAILEPGVGETPLWDTLVLSALFPADSNALLLLAALEAFDPELDWSSGSFRAVEDQDWERAWLDQFQPMDFGSRRRRRRGAAGPRPGVRLGHPPDHRAVPALAGPAGRGWPAAGPARTRLRLRLGHPRPGRAEAGRR